MPARGCATATAHHGQDHRGSDHPAATQAAQHHRTVRLPAVRQGVTKTNALEALVIAGFVRELSTRDVEAALTEALGESATVSRSTVSRICTEIKVQFEAWSARHLDDVQLDYLFLDGSHFKYHDNAAAEPVLAAWGIDTDSNPEVLVPITTPVSTVERGEQAGGVPGYHHLSGRGGDISAGRRRRRAPRLP